MQEKLYNYVFHYNHNVEEWHAIPRHLYNRYWDNRNIDGVLRSKDIKTLIEWICTEDKTK